MNLGNVENMNKDKKSMENSSHTKLTYSLNVIYKYKTKSKPPYRRQVVHPWPKQL